MATNADDTTVTEGNVCKKTDETGKPNIDFADWMGKLPTHLLDVPLHKLAIPGSHNSGSYGVKKESGLSPDAPQALKNLSSIPVIGAMATDIIHRWSKCQNLTVLEQLQAGVRFLDLRVAYNASAEELYLVHSLYGPKVSTCMEEVKTFLKEHETEVVLLDFNHFYSMELENHIQLITYLMSAFDGMLCPFSSLNALTLSSLREKGTRLVVFYHHSIVLEFPDFWPEPTIASPWADTMNVDKCLSFQAAAARQRNEAGADGERFHVCQAVLTPDTGYVMQKFGSSVRAECKKINCKLHEWMSSDCMKECQGMVFLVDFVEEDFDFVGNVVGLNK